MKNFVSLRYSSLILAVSAFALAGALPAHAARYGRVYRPLVAATAVFQTSTTTKVAVGLNRSASLLDLKVGDRISVAYAVENGALVAHHISDGVPPKSSTPGLNPAPVAHTHAHATTPAYAHVGGIVRSVDAQSGTLTIAYRARR
jgi:Cu/Ag efflux protein CusF